MDVHDCRLVVGRNLDGGVRFAGRGAANEQWHGKALPGHLFAHVYHLFKRRRDQPAQADQVHLSFAGCGKDFVRRHHHAQIDHFIIVAAQHHADNVLADVVYVAFDGGHENAALRLVISRGLLLRLHERQQIRHRLFHDTGALHHLGQEHFARAKQITDHIHSRHERTFDDVERLGIFLPGLFHVLLDIIDHAFDQRVAEAFFHRSLPPGVFQRFSLVLLFHRFGESDQPLGGIGTSVQQYILNQLQQVLGDFLIHRKLSGIDDAHVHARLDGMIKKRRVHRLAHHVITAKRKGDIAHTTTDLAARQGGLNYARGLDEINCVIIVLLHSRGDGQDVRIENDVLRRETGLFGENLVRTGADFDLALDGISLAFVVESHDHHRRAITPNQRRLLDEFRLAFFEADGIDDRFALDAFQPRFQHRPFRAVDHDRHARNVRLRRDQV